MARVLVTAGPIPARLDSVKYVTNRFKGGLALKTANELAQAGHDVDVVVWKYTDISQLNSNIEIIKVTDVMDYQKMVLEIENNDHYDGYVLAAAVANIMPSAPWPNKFPSHNYKVGEKFQIEFQIAPRIINDVKWMHPRIALIGYKLLDGSEQELILAAKKLMVESHASIIFANHPKDPMWKIAVTPDGAISKMHFSRHIEMIDKLLNEKFYCTSITEGPIASYLDDKIEILTAVYPRTIDSDTNMVFGTFAVRCPQGGFYTTSRGKKEKSLIYVDNVDHEEHIVSASGKATLNAPLLDYLFQKNPEVNCILHDHRDLQGMYVQGEYQFPGSVGDLQNCISGQKQFMFKMPHHGYMAGFPSIENALEFIDDLNKHPVRNANG